MSSHNSSLTSASSNAEFQNQALYYMAKDGMGGVVEVNITMAQIDFWNFNNTRLAILFSSQFAACLVMAVVLVAMTSRKNYRQPIFILNFLSLIFGFMRAFLQDIWLLSPWSTFYNMYSNDFSGIPRSAYHTSIATTIFPLLMLVTVSASLVVQAHAVSKIMSRTLAHILSGLSVAIVLLSIAFRFGLLITNCQTILLNVGLRSTSLIFKRGALFSSTASIWWFSLVFCYKLVHTVLTRRRNGWKRYSTFRVLAIMSACTMVIPSIFAILQYTNVQKVFPEAGTLTLTTTALLLPLSTIWARMSDQEELDSIRDSIRRGGNSSTSRNSAPTSRYGQSAIVVMGSDERKGSVAPLNTATTTDTVIERASTRDSTEIEIEKMGVRVDRSYGVNGHAC